MKKIWITGLLILALALSACMPGTIETGEAPWDGSGSEKTTEANGSSANHGDEIVTQEGQTLPSTSSEEPSTPYVSPNGLDTDSDAYCVLDEEGQILLSLNPYSAYAPASTTKVLTALVAAEHAGMDDILTVSENAVRNVSVFSSGIAPSLKPGEEFTVRELLYTMILPSTNAAANVLAEGIGGSIEGFAQMMNEKCASLGLSHSHFVNAHGCDADGHFSCAYDLAVILKEACGQEELRKILGAVSYSLPETQYNAARNMAASDGFTNGTYSLQGFFAGKPGNTANAGGSLVTAVERNGKEYYVSTMHSLDRKHYVDTVNVLNAALAKEKGTEPRLTAYVYDLSLKQNPTGVDFTWRLANGITDVRVIWWKVSEGTNHAHYIDNVPQTQTGTVHVDLSDKATYILQAAGKDAAGNDQIESIRVLFTGGPMTPGVTAWNGQSFYVDANGVYKTGAIETGTDVYYAYDDGGLATGFVGGRFFAGEDFKLVTGWHNFSGNTYYFQGDGRVVTGDYIIDGQLCRFDKYGRYQK
ncbi:MAG: serine hydrolase [Lachnospiraceae bacterium]|nr:serine hydrolase [Lachnospiraceae bacterium]